MVGERRIVREHRPRHLAGLGDLLAVAAHGQEAQRLHPPGLVGPEHVALAAQLEVQVGHREPVVISAIRSRRAIAALPAPRP